MNKFLRYFVLPALLLCSCSKTDFRAVDGGADGEILSISVAVPYPSSETKASIDGDGSGEHADRCRLQVWNSGELRYDRVVAVINYRADFDDVYLRDSDNAEFLFWADNAAGNYYVTDTLSRVRLSRPYVGCDDARDAFCRALTGAEVRNLAGSTIILERPFGQLNVIASDMGSLYSAIPEGSRDLFGSVVPEYVSLNFRMPTTYNVATKEACDTVSVCYESPIYSKVLLDGTADLNTISMDYIFAPDADKTLKDFSITMNGEGIETIHHTFTNVPVRRNWRTNIIGDIITGTTSFKIALSDEWNGEL